MADNTDNNADGHVLCRLSAPTFLFLFRNQNCLPDKYIGQTPFTKTPASLSHYKQLDSSAVAAIV